MNAVEIEEAISSLAEQPFDAATFPYAFLEAFGNKSTTLKRLQSGASNKSDIEGGVLQFNNIHLAACAVGDAHTTFEKLKSSPATAKLSMAETKCAKWRRKSVPVWLIKKGGDALRSVCLV